MFDLKKANDMSQEMGFINYKDFREHINNVIFENQYDRIVFSDLIQYGLTKEKFTKLIDIGLIKLKKK